MRDDTMLDAARESALEDPRRRRGRAFVKFTPRGHVLGLYLELARDALQAALPLTLAPTDHTCACALFDEDGRDFLCSVFFFGTRASRR